jgi:hypothetical protein
MLSSLLPDFIVELDPENSPPYKLVRQSNNSDIKNIDQLSSGEAQLVTIAIDMMTIGAMWDIKNADKRIMLIDEPDAHIHPDLQVRFADFLVRVVRKFKLQVAIATHSTTLLTAIGQFGGNDSSVIYLDRTKTNFRAEPFTPHTKELAACLGGHALMGPLFGVPLLLVEGDDDYRIWSQVPRHHVVSFAVIPSHGEEIKKYQRSLEKLFAALRENAAAPAGYALLDGDKPKPRANPDIPQDHVKFIQLSCHESENLYLTDEVLAAIGTNWDDAAATLDAIASTGKFGNKSDLLRNPQDWNRKQHDIKPVIEQITQALDKRNVPWSIRVATAIGRSRPSGQIREFLGDEVVTALWGPDPPAQNP